MTAPTGDRPRRDWRTLRRYRIWPAALLLSLPAALAVALNQPRRYVGDNRFEQYWSPGWRILRESMLWDGTRGMGRVGEEFWPITIPIALLRSLGLSPAVTEHIWHGSLLLLAGLGALSVVRHFQPRIGGAHLLAALAYMFNPFSITFLVPSNLYWNYVLTPWLLVVALRGLRANSRDERWRWAALWALLVFTAGDTDLPGLLLSVIFLLPVAVFAVHVERWVNWRAVGSWLWRAALLSVATSAATAVKVVMGASALGQRLLYTENPLEVNTASSWTESFRGLGYWVTYFSTPGRDTDVPGSLGWYESAFGILITFALPTLALVALWRMRWRVRLLFGAIALPSIVLMVGSYPPDHPYPAGRILLSAYRSIPSLSSFRNTYKAGSGLMLAAAVLVGVGASACGTWVAKRRDPRLRPIGAACLVGLIGLASLPFWTGDLYAPDKTMTSIPGYWRKAAAWVEGQPGDARVLVLPGSTQTAYRWGWAGDDILDSLFRRHPNVVPTNFPVSGAVTANVIDSLDRRISEGRLTPEVLVPIAQRLGIGYVLVRNDLDWSRIREPRPALLDSLRNSKALGQAKTFGRRGQSTTAPSDSSDDALIEQKLPPIEIYRIPGAADQDLTRSAGSPLLVDGDGDAWSTLAEDGYLTHSRPLRFAGAATDDQMANSLADDRGSLVVTDTNRRRLTLIRGPGPTSSETLAADQILSQPPQNLFERPGTQSVAVYRDAKSVAASGSGGDLSGFSDSLRPANAFDGLDRTAWRDGGLADAIGRWIRVDFRKPQALSTVTLTPYRPTGTGRSVSRVSLRFDDGSKVMVDLAPTERSVTASFAARTTRSLEVRVEATVGPGRTAVGFDEISIPGLDLQEFTAAPTHLFTSPDAKLQKALETGDVSYLFRRSPGTAKATEELRLRRQFMTTAGRAWTFSAELSRTEPLLDSLVDALLGGPVGAFGSSRVGPPYRSRGGLAVDGDPLTAWAGRPMAGTKLTVRFPSQQVDTIQISLPAGPDTYPARRLLVRVGAAQPVSAAVKSPDVCGSGCLRTATIRVPAARADSLQITLADGDGGTRPVRIAEVAISGAGQRVAPAEVPTSPACVGNLILLDGKPLAMRSDAPVLTALERGQVTLVSCRSEVLAGGAHDLATTEAGRVDELTVRPHDRPRSVLPGAYAADPQVAAAATVTARSPTAIDLDVAARRAAIVVTGQSFDAGWHATADGHDLGKPFEMEGQSAWQIPADTSRVRLEFTPERIYSSAIALSAASLVLCAWLAFGRRARRRYP